MSSVTKRQPGCFLGFIVIRMTVNLHLGVSEYCLKNLHPVYQSSSNSFQIHRFNRNRFIGLRRILREI